MTDAVQDEGGRIFLQLWHVGRISHPALQPDHMLPVAPSAITPAGDAFIENHRGEGQLVPFVRRPRSRKAMRRTPARSSCLRLFGKNIAER